MLSRGLRAASRRASLAAPLVRPAVLASSLPTARQLAAPVGLAQRQQRRSYHEKVLDHYSQPRNVGSMDKKDMDVGTGLVGAPACGDVMKLQIRVDPQTNTISDVKFKTFGCGSAIASSSYLTELVRGMSLDDAGKVKNTEIAKELCLPPVKRAYTPSLADAADPDVLTLFPPIQCTALCLPRTPSSRPSRITIPRTPRSRLPTWAAPR